MSTIKSYTDLEQSRKLAEFLPLESADMVYIKHSTSSNSDWRFDDIPPMILGKVSIKDMNVEVLPCWSLTTLLSVLPFHLIVNNQRYAFSMYKGLNKDGETYIIKYNVFNIDVCLYTTDYYNNPVDAAYEMILKLNEQNLL